jgi:segregation and condensation protein B
VSDEPSSTAAPGAQQPALDLDLFAGPSGLAELAATLEAVLVVSPDGATFDDLALATGASVERIEDAIAWHHEQPGRGVTLLRHRERVQIGTHPRFSVAVRRLLKIDREARLSPAALETLAIVAYQQPVTRAEIESVRGVDCSGVLATLHARGLIEAVGRLPTVGNPNQYGTTAAFLHHFGLRALEDLPPLGQVDGRDIKQALEAAVAAVDDPDEPAPPAPTSAPDQPAD